MSDTPQVSRAAKVGVLAATLLFGLSVYRLVREAEGQGDREAIIGVRVHMPTHANERPTVSWMAVESDGETREEPIGEGNLNQLSELADELGKGLDLQVRRGEADSARRVLEVSVHGGADPTILAVEAGQRDVWLLGGEGHAAVGSEGFETIEHRGAGSGGSALQLRVSLRRCEPGDLVVTQRFVGNGVVPALSALPDSVSVRDSSMFFLDIRSREKVGADLRTCCGSPEAGRSSPAARGHDGKNDDV